MKKFTSLFIILIIAFAAKGQESTNLQNKLDNLHEKFTQIINQTKPITGQKGIYNNFARISQPSLKSAIPTQKLDSTITLILNPESEVMENDWKQEFYYDDQMRSTLWIDKEWDSEEKTWSTDGRVVLEYNSQGLISSMTMIYADYFTGELVPEAKIEAFYSQSGILDSILTYGYESTEVWVLEGRQKYTYESGKLVRIDMSSDEEEMEIKYIYTYYADGNLESVKVYYLSDEEDEILYYQTNYIYDTMGRRTESEELMFSFSSFELEKSWRTQYQYNASNDVSVEIFSSWNENAWEETDKDEYIYTDTNFSEVAFPTFGHMIFWIEESHFTFNKLISKINTYTMVDGNWSHTEINTFYYSGEPSSSVKDLSNATFSIFPNPATESVFFNWNAGHEQLSVEIYQINGARIMQYTIYPGMAIPVSHLVNGVYLFKLVNEGQTLFSGKFVKR